jgi:uncharacterized membrane-anchored protein
MEMKNWKWLICSLFAAMLAGLSSAMAQAPKRDPAAEMSAAFEAAKLVAKRGPVDVALKDQALLKLPVGFVFIPQPEANRIMKAMGNGEDEMRLGLIFPESEGNWLVVVRYFDSGYVRDEEARDWKADEMLAQLKEGTEEQNKERVELGIPPMEIVNWVQPPTYDASTHRLVWSIESRDKGAAANSDNGINYNTYILGREGYISLNLVTSMKFVEEDKPVATALLSGTTFNSGKSYADFNASTDRVAEYGIAALVGGAAAKKLGLFAVIAAFVAKFAKLFGIAAFALIAGIGRFFKRKKNEGPGAQ